jgi:hypothetical protein
MTIKVKFTGHDDEPDDDKTRSSRGSVLRAEALGLPHADIDTITLAIKALNWHGEHQMLIKVVDREGNLVHEAKVGPASVRDDRAIKVRTFHFTSSKGMSTISMEAEAFRDALWGRLIAVGYGSQNLRNRKASFDRTNFDLLMLSECWIVSSSVLGSFNYNDHLALNTTQLVLPGAELWMCHRVCRWIKEMGGERK